MTYEEFSELFKPIADAIKDGKIKFDIDPSLYNYIMSDEYLTSPIDNNFIDEEIK